MTEQQMPARIWVGRHTGWAAFEMRGDTAYVRADIAERMAEALERIQAFVQNEFEQYAQLIEAGKGVHGEPGYVRDSVWSSWSGKRNMCEGILAAIKQENAALSKPAVDANASAVARFIRLFKSIERAAQNDFLTERERLAAVRAFAVEALSAHPHASDCDKQGER